MFFGALADRSTLIRSSVPEGWQKAALRELRQSRRAPIALRRPTALREDRLHVLIDSPYRGVYPGMVVNLPRLIRLRTLTSDLKACVLLSDKPTPFERWAVDHLLPADTETLRISRSRAYQVPHLWVPDFFTDRFSSKVPRAYRAALTAHIPRDQPLRRRIYVSRQDADRRRLLNEDEIVGALRRFGFEVVVPSTTGIEATLKAFMEADLVVGAHGAGLSHLAFSDADLIELHPSAPIYPHYLNLAHEHGSAYRSVLGAPAGDERSSFTVDTEMVITAVVDLLEPTAKRRL
jgi:capsular polysaccharide biosynthesis protein